MSQYLRDATSRLTQALSSISMEATLGTSGARAEGEVLGSGPLCAVLWGAVRAKVGGGGGNQGRGV